MRPETGNLLLHGVVFCMAPLPALTMCYYSYGKHLMDNDLQLYSNLADWPLSCITEGVKSTLWVDPDSQAPKRSKRSGKTFTLQLGF